MIVNRIKLPVSNTFKSMSILLYANTVSCMIIPISSSNVMWDFFLSKKDKLHVDAMVINA